MKNIANTTRTSLPLLLLLLMFGPAHAGELTVAAANSTCSVLKAVATLYEQQHVATVNFICKSSGRLAKGLKGKAITADIYISANKEWMDKMVKSRVVDENAVSSLWGNSLVAVAAKGDPIKLNGWNELASDKVKTIMIGDPGTAPFGRYAKQALEATELWDSVKGKISTQKHITLLADTVAASEHGTIGILFATNVNDGMKVVYEVDEAWHQPIRYYSSFVTGAANLPDAHSFMRFLQGADGQGVLSDAGFKLSEY